MSTDKNELALAIALALVQYLHERSLSLVMRVAKNNIREAVRIHRAHYAGSSKPSIITLYNHLTTLKKNHSGSITDCIISAENISTVLNAADKKITLNLSLTILLVLKIYPLRLMLLTKW